MKKLFIGVALVAALSITAACNAKTDYNSVVEEAKSLHALADKRDGNVWKQKKMKKPYVDTYLAKAAKAKKAGKDADAMKFAKQALNTAREEVKQMDNKDKPAWLK